MPVISCIIFNILILSARKITQSNNQKNYTCGFKLFLNIYLGTYLRILSFNHFLVMMKCILYTFGVSKFEFMYNLFFTLDSKTLNSWYLHKNKLKNWCILYVRRHSGNVTSDQQNPLCCEKWWFSYSNGLRWNKKIYTQIRSFDTLKPHIRW